MYAYMNKWLVVLGTVAKSLLRFLGMWLSSVVFSFPLPRPLLADSGHKKSAHTLGRYVSLAKWVANLHSSFLYECVFLFIIISILYNYSLLGKKGSSGMQLWTFKNLKCGECQSSNCTQNSNCTKKPSAQALQNPK